MTPKHKGQISIATALIAASGMIIAAGFSGWFSASNRVGETEKNIAVFGERENNHYAEVQNRLNSIDKKLDILIGKNQSAVTPKAQ